MPKTHRVYNVDRKGFITHSQAVKSVDLCACAWVVKNVSIRNLTTIAEVIAARDERARTRDLGLEPEPLPNAEGRRLIYEPCPNGAVATRAGWKLIREANELVMPIDEFTERYIKPFVQAAVASDK